ncbi:unnamed protein product [Gongylonema pulchrum]|uniref:Zf-C2H2_3 domain-containing protein n=1 Tax=Gongylonema pulchrum TaxID=637853 RepID=A0A183EDM5_9BILA|nr:unnamed protein product [Gongylonema pulchrum]
MPTPFTSPLSSNFGPALRVSLPSSRSSTSRGDFRPLNMLAGLECLHELIMPFSSSPWWACSICYVAGANLDRIDEHVHSFGHKRIYIDEFHPDKLDLSNMDKITSMEKYHSVGSKIFEEQGKYETPEVLKLEGVNKNWVLQKLGLEPSDEAPNYTVGKVFGGHEALHCNVCHTILISIEETRQRCWNTHLSTKDHQRMQMIASAITDCMLFFQKEELFLNFVWDIISRQWSNNK